MAHFAEIDKDNVVIRVLVIPDEHEHRGQEYLAADLGLGGRWIQTSYNTHAGAHNLGGSPLRKNYAGIGYAYDEQADAFYWPHPPAEGWILDPETYTWKDPNAPEEIFYEDESEVTDSGN